MTKQDKAELKNITILKFYIDGCRSCSAMTQFLELESIEHESINKSSDVRSKEYDVQIVPTVIVLENDVEVGRVVGFTSTKAGAIKKAWLTNKK